MGGTGKKSMGGDDAWVERPGGPRKRRAPRPSRVPAAIDHATGYSMFRLLRPPQMTDTRAWVADCTYRMATSIDELRAYLKPAMDAHHPVGVDTETKYFNVFERNPVAGYSFSAAPGTGIYVPVGHEGPGYEHNLPLADVLQTMVDLDAATDTLWFNYLYDGTVLKITHGVELQRWQDVLFAVWLHDCEANTHGLKPTAQKLLGVTMPTYKDLTTDDDDEQLSFVDIDPSDPEAITYVCADADMTRRLWLDRRVSERVRQQQAIYDLERAFFVPFQRAMINGCYLADDRLAMVEDQIGNFVKDHRGKVVTPMREGGMMADFDRTARAAFGIPPEVNLNSGDQLVPYLLAAGVPLTEKTPSGDKYSVSSKVINTLAKDHPGIAAYIAWKKLEALDRNYVRKLRAAHARFGPHVRFPFKQYGAPTGRMACGGDGKKADAMAAQGYVNVNIQSLPDSEKEAYLPDIRCAITAPPGWVVVAIDFSQFQLRIAANWSREPAWVQTYTTHAHDPERNDLHMVNARIAKTQPDAPAMVPNPQHLKDPTQPATMDNPIRKLGKTLNFAVLFQAGDDTVAKAAKIAVAEAKRVLQNFWAGVPVLATAIETAKRRARTEKMCKTWLGRLRPLAHYFDAGANKAMVALGEREAINHPIQGGEADLFKIAAIKVDRVLTARGWHDAVKVCLFMHDEMVYRVRAAMVAEVVPVLLATMESVKMPGCPVPFVCDAAVGPDWGTLTKWDRTRDAVPAPMGAEVRPVTPTRPAPPPLPVPPAAGFARRA